MRYFNTIILDTECTGLPIKPVTSFMCYPNLIQLAYSMHQTASPLGLGRLLKKRNFIVKPYYALEEKHKDAEKIHGISRERADREGFLLEDVLRQFIQDIEENRVQTIIVHNAEFDLNVLLKAMYDFSAMNGNNVFDQFSRTIRQCVVLCTMKSTTSLVKKTFANACPLNVDSDLKRKFNQRTMEYKWPRLSELHEFLFDGRSFEGAHDAMVDVDATARCVDALLKLDHSDNHFKVIWRALYQSHTIVSV